MTNPVNQTALTGVPLHIGLRLLRLAAGFVEVSNDVSPPKGTGSTANAHSLDGFPHHLAKKLEF